MTTIIYKNGALYSDTQGTKLSTGEIFKVKKLHALDDCVLAFSGYIDLAEIFLQKTFRNKLEIFPFIFYIDPFNVADKGNTTTIILADKKKVRVYSVENVWKRGRFNLLRRKKIYETELNQNLVFSIGSGSTKEINEIAKQYSPEAAIKHASSVDFYTNDVITKLDIRELFGI